METIPTEAVGIKNAEIKNMEQKFIQEFRETEPTYWWYVNKRKIVENLLRHFSPSGKRLLEIGSGGGYFVSQLSGRGWDVVAGDIHLTAAHFAREHGVNNTLVFDANRIWPFTDNSFDVLIMLDVLEHLEDDAAVLAECFRILRPGATVVITVPAHPYLYGHRDELLSHKRRYTRKSLSTAIRSTEFEILKLTYWNAISYLPVLALAWKEKVFGTKKANAEMPKLSKFTNAILKGWGSIESALIPYLYIPMGLSLVVVLTKKKESGQ